MEGDNDNERHQMNDENNEDRLLRLPEAAAFIGISETTLRTLIREDAIDAVLVRGKLRVRSSAVQQFIRESITSRE